MIGQHGRMLHHLSYYSGGHFHMQLCALNKSGRKPKTFEIWKILLVFCVAFLEPSVGEICIYLSMINGLALK